MKGFNSLIFNKPTMEEAVQEYLEKRMPTEKFRVTDVTSKGDLYDVRISFINKDNSGEKK